MKEEAADTDLKDGEGLSVDSDDDSCGGNSPPAGWSFKPAARMATESNWTSSILSTNLSNEQGEGKGVIKEEEAVNL